MDEGGEGKVLGTGSGGQEKNGCGAAESKASGSHLLLVLPRPLARGPTERQHAALAALAFYGSACARLRLALAHTRVSSPTTTCRRASMCTVQVF